MKTENYAAESAKENLHLYTIERRSLHNTDISIEIDYCGVCHTDLHFVTNDWGTTEYPLIPGHEIVGKITEIGSAVSKFKVGDIAAIGSIVNACGQGKSCEAGNELNCHAGFTATYNSPVEDPRVFTYGGYSQRIVPD